MNILEMTKGDTIAVMRARAEMATEELYKAVSSSPFDTSARATCEVLSPWAMQTLFSVTRSSTLSKE
eukprot:CAMPEP_0184657462 /NCGR_PEP_ID=MMETSP0308-20130426/19825_1 /TAXON_ID=38269 /ORGANISM="Gloeochaete witrockiana, Strain SAG 46.84" /LENGTH=66 /DNA_ID=CAMNT_0027095329 /DNA_START=999 /DNA_END=1199 /DNA_ORIENTATION=+